jgi:hypothetical protein
MSREQWERDVMGEVNKTLETLTNGSHMPYESRGFKVRVIVRW